jgi:hypothetical protein
MKKVAFTIVLNGMPFIKKQAEIIPNLFDEWYIVEGCALPVLDTSWCVNMDKSFYTDKGLSVDGTTEFLNSISSNKIKIIRKNGFWNGKVEMCNSFMSKIDNCILMEFDVDEIWKTETLKDVLNYAENNNHFDGMLFKCNFFVGPNLVIVSENCYSDGHAEWIRLWRITDKTFWVSHEPPRLKGANKYLSKSFTKSKGWVFDHYAYVLESQLKFKENYYGYYNALSNWKKLQINNKFPCRLNDFLPWVDKSTTVDII